MFQYTDELPLRTLVIVTSSAGRTYHQDQSLYSERPRTAHQGSCSPRDASPSHVVLVVLAPPSHIWYRKDCAANICPLPEYPFIGCETRVEKIDFTTREEETDDFFGLGQPAKSSLQVFRVNSE